MTDIARIRQTIADHLGLSTPPADTANLYDLPGFDSLDAVEIVMLVEDMAGIEIGSEDMEGFRTIADLATIVARETAAT